MESFYAFRRTLRALRPLQAATGYERAAWTEPSSDRRRAFDRVYRSRRIREPWYAAEQCARVGLAWRIEQRRDRSFLHQHAAVENDCPAAHLSHQVEVVR